MLLIVLCAASTFVVAEFMYDAQAAVVSLIFSLVVASCSLVSLIVVPGPPHKIVAWGIKGLMGICLLIFFWVLLIGSHQSDMDRAFRLGHVVLLLMSCKFFMIRRLGDYNQILMMTLLLMVVAAITAGGIFIAPFFVVYMLLMVFFLLLYQFQIQIDQVNRTRLIGIEPREEDREDASREIGSYWRQLHKLRFNVTCGAILALAFLLSMIVFFAFPRLEAGDLLGSNFGSNAATGFGEQLTLGGVENDQTLRQTIARVSVKRDGKAVGRKGNAFYLRCAAMDSYKESAIQEGQFSWVRSFVNRIYSRVLPQEEIGETPQLVEQEILLNPLNASFLPGTFPIHGASGLDDEKLMQGYLDRAVNRYHYNPQETIHYKVASLAEIDPQRAYAWFSKRLELLGGYWLFAGNETDVSTDSRFDLAYEIAGEMVDRRDELYEQQEIAFRKWLKKYNDNQPDSPFRGEHRRYTEEPVSEEDLLLQERLAQDLYLISVELAKVDRIVAGQLEGYLQTKFEYSTEPPPQDPYDPEFVEDAEDDELEWIYPDPIDVFLSDKGRIGNCEYFASAMVMLCRSVGIPARIASGYLAQEYLEEFDYYVVRQRDAHCWAEIYTADRDWVRFDPTPVGDAAESSSGLVSGMLSRLSHYFEKLQYQWLKYTSTQDGPDVMQYANQVSDWVQNLEGDDLYDPGRQESSVFRDWFTHHHDEPYVYLYFRWMIFFLFLIDGGIGLKELYHWLVPWYLKRRRQKLLLASYADSSIDFYRHMLQMLQEIELVKPPHMTPREFAFQVQKYSDDFNPVGRISEAYYKVQFGNAQPQGAEWEAVQSALNTLDLFVQSLRKTVKRPWVWESDRHLN
jgi:hypothetical protein